MPDDTTPEAERPQTFDRRGPEAIEPGRKGGSAAAQGRATTKDAASDTPAAGDGSDSLADRLAEKDRTPAGPSDAGIG